MRRLILIFLMFLVLSSMYGQSFETDKGLVTLLSNETGDDNIKLSVNNNRYCPVTVLLTVKAKNLKANRGSRYFLVPSRTLGHELLTFKRKDIDSSSILKAHINWVPGNLFLKEYDTLYPYSLPYETDKAFPIFQGYNSKGTHKGVYALDFGLPMGTPITAARGGIVIGAVDRHNVNCYQKGCEKYNNYISIYHEDNTFGVYAHLQYDSALVKRGDKVIEGQVIAKSGNTGYSSGPHLHFEVHKRNFDKAKSLRTFFRYRKGGKKLGVLKRGSTYLKRY